MPVHCIASKFDYSNYLAFYCVQHMNTIEINITNEIDTYELLKHLVVLVNKTILNDSQMKGKI